MSLTMGKGGILREDMAILSFCVFNMVVSIQSVSPTTFTGLPSTMILHSELRRTAPLENKVDLLITDPEPIEVSGETTCTIRMSSPLAATVMLFLVSENSNIAYPLTQNVTFTPLDNTMPKLVRIIGHDVGETLIKIHHNNTAEIESSGDAKVRVIVVHSLKLRQMNNVIGWINFVVWSISFYPQVFENFMRKSVIGLNFDYLCYNITGFIVYSVYNAGLFWIKFVQDQYFAKYGGSVIPVQPNDVFFAIHAAVLTAITIAQCFAYERGNQRVSLIAKILVSIMWAIAFGLLIPVAIGKVNWVEYLTSFSYIKLAVTLIKYVPQAYMNYKRKSTYGWSIGYVHFDFIGGVLSILQIFFLSYNNNQWNSIFGDFTKFGLALVTVIFDVLFLLQHYILYRERSMRRSTTMDIITMHDHVEEVYEQEVIDEC